MQSGLRLLGAGKANWGLMNIPSQVVGESGRPPVRVFVV